MKRLQVNVETGLYAMEVPDNFDYTDMSAVSEALLEHLSRNNMTGHTEFFENIEVRCSECGISLNDDYEKEDGKCGGCNGGE